MVAETRQLFGVHPNVSIGNDIRLLWDKKDILLCEYPFPDTNEIHTYGNITWFKTENDTITFIGLNTSSFYDEQIFAAELLLPAEALREAVMNVFGSANLMDVSDNRALCFIARIQCDWWLPFQAIINRLFEEGYINENQYNKWYAIDCRNEGGIYRRLLRNMDSEISELLKKKTKTVRVFNRVIETIISNYEDGFIDDEFVRTLAMFDKNLKITDYVWM